MSDLFCITASEDPKDRSYRLIKTGLQNITTEHVSVFVQDASQKNVTSW